MKKILFSIIALALCVTAFAQTDVKSLNGKDPQAIIRLYGTPKDQDNGMFYTCSSVLFYDNYEFYLDKVGTSGNEKWVLCGFQTNSTKFCFLSDIYPGGIKVGTKLSDLQQFDFVGSKYGRNQSGNGLVSLANSKIAYRINIGGKHANYMLMGKNYRFYYFYVENGKIVSWAFGEKADATGDPNVTPVPSTSLM